MNKEILILSQDNDFVTNKIISFITDETINLTRLNDSNPMVDYSLNISPSDCSILAHNTNKTPIDTQKQVAYWYRKGDFAQKISLSISESNKRNQRKFISYQVDEWSIVRKFMHHITERIEFTLGSFSKELERNLLIDIFNARLIGLSVPNTLVTTSKNELLIFLNSNKAIITKPLYRHFQEKLGDSFYNSTATVLVKDEYIEILSNNFLPTLFQENIEKEYEIRIFYIKGKVYPMAIFSQLDKKTKIDYRNYNREKPNRNVPCKLPEDIEDKIRQLMDKCGLDTGSIDMIKSTDGRYVFLEVNPCGQFDWLSVNCNYYIEKKIAHYLIYGNTEFN